MTASDLSLDGGVGGPPPTVDTPELGPEGPGPAADTPDDEKRRRRRAIVLLLLLGLLAALILLTIWYLLFRQPLPLPLPVIPDTQLPGYSTSIYGASSPSGVAVTPSGDRIYVAETGGDKVVRIFDAGGNQIGTMSPPAETGTDHVPVYLAIDPVTAEVYVSDRPTGTIHIYDRDGRYQRPFTPATPLVGWQPTGLAFDPAGNLYVTDFGSDGQKVVVFDRAGALVRTIGAEAELSFPNGIAVDDAGLVYVTDSNNGRLLVFGADGTVAGRIGRGAGEGNLGLPRGLAIDGQGRVFVVDSSGQGVLAYRVLGADQRSPEYIGFFGGHGIADGQFAFPMGTAVDDRGRVYIADTANGRVQVWSY
jgi:DNA-binding beta-propeller fold protein YncE